MFRGHTVANGGDFRQIRHPVENLFITQTENRPNDRIVIYYDKTGG